jgi:hypothetical protein
MIVKIASKKFHLGRKSPHRTGHRWLMGARAIECRARQVGVNSTSTCIGRNSATHGNKWKKHKITIS